MEIRLNKDNSIHISGYVNAALRESRVLNDSNGPFVEMVDTGTWARAIHNAPSIGVMFNHTRPVEARNLELYEDAIGCRFSADIYDDEIINAAEHRQLTGFSFGFNTLKDEWGVRDDGVRSRLLKEIRLHEISILNVTPAYFATVIEARDGEAEGYEVRYEELEPASEEPEEGNEIAECGEESSQEDDKFKAEYELITATIEIMKLKHGGNYNE